MSFIYAFTDTRWSAAGTTYNGIWLDLSNGSGGTAVGAAASRPVKISNNGTSIFDVDLSGSITTAGQLAFSTSLTVTVQTGQGIYYSSSATAISVYGTGFSLGDATFSVVDVSDTRKGLFMGMDTVNSLFRVQAGQFGVAYYPLCLQPESNQVIIAGITVINAADVLYVNGSMQSAGSIKTSAAVQTRARTFASLLTAASVTGGIAFITDATLTMSTGAGSTIAVGSGTNAVYVMSDGTQWKII